MSSVTKRFNVAAGRPYIDRDGNEKKSWVNLGRATQWDDGGISIELHAVPAGNWFDGKISLFPEDDQRKSNDQAPQRARPSRSAPAGGNDSADDLPF